MPRYGRTFAPAHTRRAQHADRKKRRSRGQTLIIFALSFTVLLGLAGLTIDVARAYDLYARMQRAAEAGALAGVVYMPDYYQSALPPPGDGNSATSRALQETIKDGFGAPAAVNYNDCPTPVTSVEVAVCQVSGKPNDLRVTITQTIDVVLLSGLGVTPLTLSASAQAEYVPLFAIGLDSTPNYFGDQGECNSSGGSPVNCNPTGGANHLQNFMANISGPAELKEQGDPFVYCEEGPSQFPPADPSANTSPLPYTTYNGLATNHPQYPSMTPPPNSYCGPPVPGGNPGNPDQQPPGYVGPATGGTVHPGAYNYAITVPPIQSGASVWIYNPNYVPFIASGNSCPGTQALDTFYKSLACTSWYQKYGQIGNFNGYFDDPRFYFTTTYSLYQVASPYFRNTDTPVPGATQSFRPYDQMKQDLQYHGCQTNGNQVYDFFDTSGPSVTTGLATFAGSLTSGSSYSASPNFSTSACVAPPPCQTQWCPLAGNLVAGTYRLAVEATNYVNPGDFTMGWGEHGYGVKVCAKGSTQGTGCPGGGSVAAWNNMDITLSFPSAKTQNIFPLGEVPASYAGRSVNIGVFDLGDTALGNNVWYEIVPPATNDLGQPNPPITVTYPQGVRLGVNPGDGNTAIAAASNGDNIYNGLWLNSVVQLPPNYGGGMWKIYVYSTQGQDQDTIAVSFTLIGSPVHLVPSS